ncbi:MAG TPA: helix-turn-helix transcriptional regulator [Gaiellaceae bacterium]|nr:helix-turn-helix transcriptional regulator [Gaiellaceae bacterium]
MVDRLILEELRRAPAHGYPIGTAFARRGLRVAEATIDSALRRLERDSLVAGKWQDGRRRRVFRLTRSGDEALRVGRLEVRSSGRR